MSESVGEIVAWIEEHADDDALAVLMVDLRVLIASWRERGEALKEIEAELDSATPTYNVVCARDRARAALATAIREESAK